MANIQTLLAKIMSAIYGEEVRGSIHDAIEAINDEVEEWTGLQDGTVTTAKLANTAVTTAKVADGAITRAKLNADVVDTTLAVSGAPADAKATGDKVNELKTSIKTTTDTDFITFSTVYNGTALNPSNANCICLAGNYTTGRRAERFPVSEGDLIDVTVLKDLPSGYKYNFNVTLFLDATTDSGTAFGGTAVSTKDNLFPFRVPYNAYGAITIGAVDSDGNTYAIRADGYTVNDFIVTNATKSVKETASRNSNETDILKDEVLITTAEITTIFQGTGVNAGNTNDICTGGVGYAVRRTARIPVSAGDVLDFRVLKELETGYHYSYGVTFSPNNTIDCGYLNKVDITYLTEHDKVFPITVPVGYTYIAITVGAFNGSTVVPLNVNTYKPQDFVLINCTHGIKNRVKAVEENISDSLMPSVIERPIIRNGTLNNASNQNSVAMVNMVPTYGAKAVFVQFDFNFTYGMGLYAKSYSEYSESQATTSNTNAIHNFDPIPSNFMEKVSSNSFIYYTEDAEAVAFAVGDFDGTNINPLRIANVGNCIRIVRMFDYYSHDEFVPSVIRNLKQARHFNWEGSNVQPLTLLHFSDIHGDAKALNRINAQIEKYGDLVDEAICTGDIVTNSNGQIASWWNPKIMTVIGNHDTASYSGGVYDWTALSMADRDAYYIAPFESNWGITHTSGTSYYYKDYTDAKVRMIVLDAMLYSGSNESEATAQTTWLAYLLSSAITNGLHVLIAIHAPHGGATPVDCTFTEYGTGTMPTYSDCNTPQVIIDTVATAIGNGLKFIGYIVGHTHRDVVWDAEGDGTQLMYCVASANVANRAQWRASDQYHDYETDVYNLVTIDTANTLIKIVRGGGADISDKMTPREAVCFNYSTGQKIGEVL